MTASVSSSCPGRRPSKSSSAAMSPVSRAAMAASIGASAAKGGSACEQRVSSRKDSAMSATKILWGQILVVSLIVLVTTWTATQWTAWQLGFQPQLGRPWFELFGWPIYHPPAFFWWWYFYDAYAPHVFIEGAYRSEEHTSELQSLMRISYA